MSFVPIAEAIEEIRAGNMVVVVDDEDRENEGDLTIAAEKITPEIVNFMATHGRGLICLALTAERCDALRLPPMSPRNTSNFGTAFCESIDAREGVTTGISALDRTVTIWKTIDPACKPHDLARPGHVFPLRAREGGRAGPGGTDRSSGGRLARLRWASRRPARHLREIMNADGTMARVPQLVDFPVRKKKKRHGLKMAFGGGLDSLPLEERNGSFIGSRKVASRPGSASSVTSLYASDLIPGEHLALVRGEVQGRENVLVRMHSRCVYGEAFGSTMCDCGRTGRASLQAIAEEGTGVLVYLHAAGPLRPASHGREAPRSQHEHGIGAQILSDLGLHTIRLLTNHPRRVVALEGFGIEIVDQIPVPLDRV